MPLPPSFWSLDSCPHTIARAFWIQTRDLAKNRKNAVMLRHSISCGRLTASGLILSLTVLVSTSVIKSLVLKCFVARDPCNYKLNSTDRPGIDLFPKSY